jgi:hypothetical protein
MKVTTTTVIRISETIYDISNMNLGYIRKDMTRYHIPIKMGDRTQQQKKKV